MIFWKKLSTWFTVRSIIILFIYQIIALGINANFIIIPLLQRAADDLAAIIVLSAQTWVELPPQTRHAFQEELLINHNLLIEPSSKPLAGSHSYSPYIKYLEKELSYRLENTIHLKTSYQGKRWYWFEIKLAEESIRISFSSDRLNISFTNAIILFFIVQVILSIFIGFWLANTFTKPLKEVIRASKIIGKGELPPHLSEDQKLYEISLLTKSFNQMSAQIQNALAQRTILLAGISHDLRTPLTRLRLQLELLKEDQDPQNRIQKMEKDIETINYLIEEFLLLAKGIQNPKTETKNIVPIINTILDTYPTITRLLDCKEYEIPVDEHIFTRVLTNLLDNALLYGKLPIILYLDCNNHSIDIVDKGEGIPQEKLMEIFQPFVRLNQNKKGSGLGLAIVKQLCIAHKWDIEISTQTSEGTQIRIKFKPSSKPSSPQSLSVTKY